MSKISTKVRNEAITLLSAMACNTDTSTYECSEEAQHLADVAAHAVSEQYTMHGINPTLEEHFAECEALLRDGWDGETTWWIPEHVDTPPQCRSIPERGCDPLDNEHPGDTDDPCAGSCPSPFDDVE